MIFWEMFMYHQNTLKILSLQYIVMFAVKDEWASCSNPQKSCKFQKYDQTTAGHRHGRQPRHPIRGYREIADSAIVFPTYCRTIAHLRHTWDDSRHARSKIWK